MNEFILITLVTVSLLVVLTVLIYYVIKRVNLLMKNIFLDKISQLDFLSEDKENKINQLNEQISIKENEIKELEGKIEEYKAINFDDVLESDVVLPKYVDLDDGNLLENYKTVKEKFSFDVGDFLKKIINNDKNSEKDEKRYLLYKNVRNYFTYDVIYKLETYQSDEQYLIVFDLLSDEEKKALGKYLVKEKFDLKVFISKIDDLLVKTNPKIVVYVGDKNRNYDSIDPRIETIYDEKIMEGFKVLYKGVVLDYSV